ncbi:hypothetical protein IGI04_033344, partial [Brassica rapa subsp. trilocularis]
GRVGGEKTNLIAESSFLRCCVCLCVVVVISPTPTLAFLLCNSKYDFDSFTSPLAENAILYHRIYTCPPFQHSLNVEQEEFVPALGCIQSRRTFVRGLSANTDWLSRNLVENTLIYVDIYNPLLEIILNPKKFQVVGLGFCGTGLLKVAVLCNKFTPISYSRSDCVLG